MKELELPPQEPLPIEAKVHLQKKITSLRIPIGAKLFGYNLLTGECAEVVKEKSIINPENGVGVAHHKVTYSPHICYVVAINQINAIRKGEKTKKRLMMKRPEPQE